MARTGRFGRMPRAAPDLTMTIVQMVREYNAQQDQNFVDAWKNGGKVDGKAVTDGRLLQHFKDRRGQLDKNDPMYDEWSNRIDQYTFAIDDSKMQVKYDNGKATDAQMAAFYQKWADKTPDNTEFDRTLLSAVGKFRSAAAAKGRAGAAAAGAKKFETDIDRIENNGPKQARDANDALVKFAVDTGLVPADAKSLADLDVSSGRAAEFLDILQDGIDNGNPVVQGRIDVLTKQLRKIDPEFNWATAQSWFSQTFEKGAKGDQKGLEYLKGSKYSTKAWEEHFSNSKANTQFANTKMAGLGIYNDAKANSDWLDDQIEAAHGNPYLEAKALAEYNTRQTGVVAQLQKAQVGDYQDPLMIGLINEQRNYQSALAGGTDKPQSDWRDAVAGGTSQGGAEGTGGTRRYELTKSTAQAIDLLSKGGWLQIEPDGNDPTGTKAVYTVQPKEALQGLNTVLLPGSGIRDPLTGLTIPVYALPVPVQMSTVDPNGSGISTPSLKTDPRTGLPIPVPPNQDGTPKTDPITGEQIFQETGDDSGIEAIRSVDSSGNGYFIYRTRAKDGSYVLSLDPPLQPGAKATTRVDASGKVVLQITVDPTMVDPTTGKATGSKGATPYTPPGAPTVAPPTDKAGRQAEWDAIAGEYKAATGRDLEKPEERRGQVPMHVDPNSRDAQGRLYGTDRASKINASVDKYNAWVNTGKPVGERKAEDSIIQTGAYAEGVAGQVTKYGGYDATKYVDTTATNVNPTTGELNTGYYRSTLGLSLAHEFNVLKPQDPDYQKKLNALTASVQGGQTQLQSMFATAQKNGNQGDMTRLMAELNYWQHDQINLANEVSRATNRTTDPASLLTSPANPVNQYFGMSPTGAATDPRTGAPTRLSSSDAVGKWLTNASADRIDGALAIGAGGTRPGGGPAKPGAAPMDDPRALKLPGLGDVPFLKPLLDFAGASTGVPQLAPNGSRPPTVQPGPSAGPLAAPAAPIAKPATPIKPPAAPKPPKPDEPDKPEPTPGPPGPGYTGYVSGAGAAAWKPPVGGSLRNYD